ncbi:hypothetical protein [Amycolatopsis sp. A1MSW2902]|uniref:hypothetical protein n=1 Tax=Amycolatopsis sp. A1MSW2902 TaxID=687413 RepID=UPI003FCC89C6
MPFEGGQPGAFVQLRAAPQHRADVAVRERVAEGFLDVGDVDRLAGQRCLHLREPGRVAVAQPGVAFQLVGLDDLLGDLVDVGEGDLRQLGGGDRDVRGLHRLGGDPGDHLLLEGRLAEAVRAQHRGDRHPPLGQPPGELQRDRRRPDVDRFGRAAQHAQRGDQVLSHRAVQQLGGLRVRCQRGQFGGDLRHDPRAEQRELGQDRVRDLGQRGGSRRRHRQHRTPGSCPRPNAAERFGFAHSVPPLANSYLQENDRPAWRPP